MDPNPDRDTRNLTDPGHPGRRGGDYSDAVAPLLDDPDDADISLVDFGFSIDGQLEAGEQVTVANTGQQAHELAFYRLADGVTFDEVEVALSDPAAGGPDLPPAGGAGALALGAAVELTLPEEPGRYVAVCFLPDVTGDGEAHVTHGMATEVTLR